MRRFLRLLAGKLLCRHRWREESRTHWGPALLPAGTADYTSKIIQTYICTKCGKFERRRL